MAKANWFARGAIIGTIIGGLLAGVPWLGLIGTPKGEMEGAFLALALYGTFGSVAGLLVGALAGLVITAIVHGWAGIVHEWAGDSAVVNAESRTSSQETPSR